MDLLPSRQGQIHSVQMAALMARIEPFHTVVGPWHFAKVYHDSDRCIAGNANPQQFRTEGKGECRECSECQVLNREDEPGPTG
jgi:hypothetical protein